MGKTLLWYICVCATKYNICFSFARWIFLFVSALYLFILFFRDVFFSLLLLLLLLSKVFVDFHSFGWFVLFQWFPIHFFTIWRCFSCFECSCSPLNGERAKLYFIWERKIFDARAIWCFVWPMFRTCFDLNWWMETQSKWLGPDTWIQ